MERLNISMQETVNLLSYDEMRTIQGGNSSVFYYDAQGYSWQYEYNDSDQLIAVYVTKQQCIE